MIPESTIREGFTQSELSMFSACPQKWDYRYNRRMDKPDHFSFPLMVGTAFHSAMEILYHTGFKKIPVATLQFPTYTIPSAADIEKAEYWNKVLSQMVIAYAAYWKNQDSTLNIISFEEEVEVNYRTLRLRGKIDLTLDRKGIYILDHKTCARITKDFLAGWDFRFQFLFYLWLKHKADPDLPLKGYGVNLVKKPELRQKVGESLDGFAARCFTDMVSEPEKYFYREWYPIDKKVLHHFETEVLDPKIDVLKLAINGVDAVIKNKNTDECQRLGYAPCQFIDLCRHGYSSMKHLYRVRDKKHEELETEND